MKFKHAEKMVLVPESEYKMLLELKKSQSKGSDLKTKMKSVLKGKRDYEAAKKMSQLVGQYIRYKQKETKPKPAKSSPSFLHFFAPIYHQKVTMLMNELNAHGIKWTDDRELILKNGIVVPNTNIVDLMREAIVGTRKKVRESTPFGWKEFVEAIATTHIPLSMFTKRTTKQDIEEARHPRHEPEEEDHGSEPEPEQRQWEMY